MVNPISLPSWREDQPSAAESSIANTLAGKNMALGGTLLNEYAAQRGFAQQNYHDYIANINDMQRQNLQQTQQETVGKLLEGLGAHPTPGMFGLIQKSLPGLIPDAPDVEHSIRQAANAANLEKTGRGLGAAGNAGISLTADDSGNIVPTQGVAPQVQAAGIRAGGEVTAAGIRANGGGDVTVQRQLTDSFADPSKVTFKGPAARAYLAAHPPTGMTAGELGLPPAPRAPGSAQGGSAQGGGGASGAAGMNPPPAAVDEGSSAPAAGAGGAGGGLATALARLQKTSPRDYTNIMQGIAKNGGKPNIQSGYIIGGDNTRYALPPQ